MRTCILAAALLLAACDEGPASPALQLRVAELFREGTALEVGGVLTLTAAEAGSIILPGFADGAEYVYVPFNASESATAQLELQVQGTNVLPPTGASASRAAGPSRAAIPLPGDPPEDARWHLRLRQRESRELTPLVRAAAAAPDFSRAAAGAIPAAPALGDVLEINANAEQPCRQPDLRRGRVVALSGRAVVVEDLANPSGGFSEAEYRNVAQVFDTLIYPVSVRNFGEPRYASFIAPQERIILFYTRAVNDLTAPGSNSYVGGFFFGRDLYPRQPQGRFEACPASNQAPIMYLLAPDPRGEAGSVRSRDFVLRVTLGTVAHEFQHLINQARRLFVTAGAQPFEEVWLNEGLSHIAEELMFYHSTRLGPRENIGPAALVTPHVLQMFFTYQVSNFGRYISYLENPDTTALIGVDDLPTRGASWAFLRYAADQEPGEDALFFRRLVDGVGSGVPNLARALPVSPIDLMQSWTVSVFTDDALPGVVFPPLYQQPSWNFRSVITGFKNAQGTPLHPGYPLRVSALTAQEQTFRLKPGGAAFLRFRVPAGEEAVIRTTAGGTVPGERLRISVVRID
ncbi:MAG TPA: hypothetical protein VGR37_02305 [Longimicrobiaceae bacterium]|nr:hypothetical protein [Longimicrobiaceae bacterium]